MTLNSRGAENSAGEETGRWGYRELGEPRLGKREAACLLTAPGLWVGDILLEASFSALDSGKGEASWRPLGLKGWSAARGGKGAVGPERCRCGQGASPAVLSSPVCKTPDT